MECHNIKTALEQTPADIAEIIASKASEEDDVDYGQALFQEALQLQWDPQEKFGWNKVPSKNDPILEYERFPIYHVPEYWDRLSDIERVTFNRKASAYTISQFMYGEALAAYAAARCSSFIPGVYDKGFLALQVVEEKRHADVFRRYLLEALDGEVYPISTPLQMYYENLSKESRWHFLFVALHIVIESVAQAGFENMAQYAQDPLLQEIVSKIEEDEERHVAYGMMTLKRKLTEIPRSELEELARFAHDSLVLVSGRYFPEHAYRAVGFSKEDIDRISALSAESPSRRDFRKRTIGKAWNNLTELGLLGNSELPQIDALYEESGLTALMQ